MCPYGQCNVVVRLVVVLLCITSICADESDYFAILPSTAYSNQTVEVLLVNLDFQNDCKVTIKNSGSTNEETKTTTVAKGNFNQCIIPSAWYEKSGKTLQLEFLTSNELYGEVGKIQLRYQPKVLIQMSQRVYSPGDFIKYRILLTDPQYEPMPPGVRFFYATIFLDDGLYEILSQSVKLDADEIHSGEYLLGHQLELGQWTLGVKIGDQTTKTHFQVLQYTAPIHEISITTKDIIMVTDRKVELDVSARYAFGEPMKGTLQLELFGDREPYLQKGIPINGNTQIHIPMDKLVNVPGESKNVREVIVNATIMTTNQITERFHQYHTVITIYNIPYNLSLHKLVSFENGNNVTFLVQLTNPIGKPLLETSPEVTVNAASEETGPISSFNVAIDQLGTAVVSVKLPDEAHTVIFTATYKEATATLQVEENSSYDLHARLVSNGVRKAISVTSSAAVNDVVIMQSSMNRNSISIHRTEIAKTHHHISDDKLSINSTIDRIHVFVMNSGNVVYTTVPLANTLPVVKELQFQLHPLEEDNYNLTVAANPNERVGIAVYEGVVDESHIRNEIELMFSCPVDPEDDYISVVSYDVHKVGTQSFVYHAPSAGGLVPLLFWNATRNRSNFTFNIPLHVKTWTVAAFAYSEQNGLRVAVPETIRRESPVEIHIHVPNSVTGLETVHVDVYIVNKLNHTTVLLVQLQNFANEFIFVNNSGRMDAESKTVYGTLTPYEVQRAEFVIRPKKLGTIKLTACAKLIYPSGEYSYATTVLRVDPENALISNTIARYVNVLNSQINIPDIKINIPRTAEPGSEKVSIKLSRDQQTSPSLSKNMLLDTLTESLDPYTMAMRASLVLEVIIKGRMNWPERMAIAREIIETSIEKIEDLANADGSFNIADDRTASSTCRDTLTAVHALIFAKKAIYTPAQGRVLEKSLDWLKLKQSAKGSFCETGDTDEIPSIEITAHALLVFLKLDTISWKYESVIQGATDYLISSSKKLSDPYHLALTAYALQLAQRKKIDTPNARKIESNLSDLINKLLVTKLRNPSNTKWWWSSTVTTDLEATAYALLLWTENGSLIESELIFNWLRQQPYRLGATTNPSPNSRIALRALIAYADRMIFQQHTFNWSLQVIVSGSKTPIHMPFDNEMDHNKAIQLPPKTRSVNINVKGTLTGYFSISYSYIMPKALRDQKFDIRVTKFTRDTENYEDWQVCLTFVPKGYTEKTNMVKCEISFPTGYIADDESVDLLRGHYQYVTNTMKNDDTVLVIVFETISIQPECFNVTGFRQTKTARQLPGMIKVHDLTDPDKFGFQSFDTVQ
ncbi:A.superbus venom factor 1-like [Anopheles albimanus]|uniref:Alpha-macroglobulin receptor-binding domain-containing protein n=1 Tax=Anopheles albimanus TaxID=7167 RepID=A0A8W7J9M1_ANOAL|nr:A.superbus venom factor 1-like [Anopheles albimanus]